MPIKHSHTAAAAATLCLGLAACGASGTASSGTGSRPGKTTLDGLVALLPVNGDIPGFVSSQGVVTADSVVAATSRDASIGQMESDAKNLHADGFLDDVSQSQSAATGQTAGTAYVGEFGTAAGATAYRAYFFGLLSKPGPETGTAAQNSFTLFTVPGVPGAEGDAQVSHMSQGGVAANVQWLEGDCVFELGAASSRASKPLSAPLIAGAQAIYTRTRGACRS